MEKVKVEKDLKIAYQGTIGANSHYAATVIFPEVQYCAYNQFDDVFESVTKGRTNYGIIPIENSCAGRVSEIHNLLNQFNIYIIAEKFINIEHHLCALTEAKFSNIKSIYSHQQAFMQSRNFVLEHPNLKTINYVNTAAAAQYVAQEKDITKATLCNQFAAKNYNLSILKKNVEDHKDNNTVFIVISSNRNEKENFYNLNKDQPFITTLLFTVRNIPGAIYRCLGGFATHNINLLKLESYISTNNEKQAKFFISFIGHPNDNSVQYALEELGFFSKAIKLLGVYQADATRFKD